MTPPIRIGRIRAAALSLAAAGELTSATLAAEATISRRQARQWIAALATEGVIVLAERRKHAGAGRPLSVWRGLDTAHRMR